MLHVFSFEKNIYVLVSREREEWRGGGRRKEGRKRERERERETPICSSTYVRIHWFSPVCALTRDQTHNLGISR